MSEAKYALVTGSTKGIGKQIAIDLLNKNYFVILNYSKDESAISDLKKELSLISNKFKIIKCDMSIPENIHEFSLKIKAISSALDVIVLNAGATNRKGFYELSIEEWNEITNTNLSCPFFLLQELGKSIKDDGNIIFIGSILGIFPHSLSIPYGVSKAGVHMLSKYLVKEFNDKRITVNTIAPGSVETLWQKDKPEEIRKSIESKIALHRFANVKEVSSTCMHLIENRYINGQTIILDGGYNYK